MDAPLRRHVSPQDRFFRKVEKTDGCWEWIGAKDSRGYGSFRMNGRAQGAHRVAYEWANGPIGGALEVDHICLNPACVKPSHLRPATHALNSQNRGGAYSNSTTGVRGVYWRADQDKWQAKAVLDFRDRHLGYYASRSEAESVVTEWRRTHMPYSEMDKRKETA